MLELYLAVIIIAVSIVYYLELHRIEWFAIYAYIIVLFKLKLHVIKAKNKTYSFVDLIESKVDCYPNRVQFINIENEKSYTLKNIDQLANQIGHWGISLGLKQKDTAALMVYNHPDYVSLWVGLAKIGVSSALINTNSTGKSTYNDW